MKVSNFEEFKLRVNKALLLRDMNVSLNYKLYEFKFSEEHGMWEITKNGLLHCTWGPAAIHEDGTQEWWYMGQRHREGGPAVIRPDGSEEWWYMGYKHRADGPVEYWYMGEKVSTKEDIDGRKKS